MTRSLQGSSGAGESVADREIRAALVIGNAKPYCGADMTFTALPRICAGR